MLNRGGGFFALDHWDPAISSGILLKGGALWKSTAEPSLPRWVLGR